MSDQSIRFGLPCLLPSQAQKHVTHNEALHRIDALLQPVLEARAAQTPPVSPQEGRAFGLGAAPTGDWAGRAEHLAWWSGGIWHFLPFFEGLCVWDAVAGRQIVWTGTAWSDTGLGGSIPGLGIETAWNTTNRLAVAGAATLLTHAGAGHRLKVNKAAGGETASVLFQSDFTGHAEMGLAGSTDFSIKVSSDGSAWTEALAFDAVQGLARGAAVQSQAGDAAPGRLMTVGAFGLGGETALPVSDLDDAVDTGFFRYGGSALNAPFSSGGGLLTISQLAGRKTQIAFEHNTGKAAIRFVSEVPPAAGDWQDWQNLYHAGSLLGPVSQSGGQPTGAVIESGSTVDGDYTRWADGTQVCRHRLTSSAAGGQGWTYPAGFVAAPQVLATAQAAGNARIATVSAITATGADLHGWTPAGARSAVALELLATGRWF